MLGASGLSVVPAGRQRSWLHNPARAHPPLPSPSHHLRAPARARPPLPASRQCLHSHAACTCPPTTCTHLYSLPAPAHAAFSTSPAPSLGSSGPPGQGAGKDLASIGCVPSPVPVLDAGGGSGGWRPWDREAAAGGAWRRLPDSSFITAAGPGHGGKARLDFKLENKPRIL